ncbi:MAG: hypothetical protein D6675_04510 [Gemmatimonadetes bacterium]|nr:MAG: hypothetical protein D6675_04510 [Gemmatimonadota bacterium]
MTFSGSIEHLRDRQLFDYFLLDRNRGLFRIFSKAPFGTTEAVVKYLGRYTHRVAIANSRILEVTDDGVEFSYRDYRDGGKTKTMRLNPVEFLRRFLSHVLPKGFQKIRSYGFLAGSIKTKMLTRIRQALKMAVETVKKSASALKCPECKPVICCLSVN